MRIIVRPLASDEADEAGTWYETQREGLAAEFLAAVAAALDLILSNPRAGVVMNGVYRRILVRRFPFGIIYRLDGDDIVIIAVAHTSREPGYWRGRE